MTATIPAETSRAWVDVDLGALVANARIIARVSGARLLPMVKANGYGLGAAAVARALETLSPWGFGVATPEEGAALRDAGIRRPIVVFTPLQSSWIEPCLRHDLRPAVGDVAALEAWTARSDRPFHLEIDTGLSRAGVRWDDTASLGAVVPGLARAPGWEGVFTHFHSAEHDPASLELQWERFQEVLRRLGARPPLVHAANSGAALRGARYAADLVRPGIFLYGGEAGATSPVPVARLQARVVAVRRVGAGDPVSYGATWRAPASVSIATLAVGYADGWPRAEGRPRAVELGGRVVPLAGRVTMDMCMAVIESGEVAPGDAATIYGGAISLDAQARAAGTIAYELLTALAPRVPRLYREPA